MRGRLWNLALYMFVLGFILNLLGIVSHVVVSAFAKRWFGTPLPARFTTEWFQYAWTNFDLGRVLGVTVFVALAVVVLALVLGFPAAYNNAIPADIRRFPYVTIAGYAPTWNGALNRPNDNHAFTLNLNKVTGTHAIKFGFEYRLYRQNQYQPDNESTGNLNFGTTYTQGPLDNSPASPLGQGLASMLLGITSSGYVDRRSSYATDSSGTGRAAPSPHSRRSTRADRCPDKTRPSRRRCRAPAPPPSSAQRRCPADGRSAQQAARSASPRARRARASAAGSSRPRRVCDWPRSTITCWKRSTH